MKRIVFGLLVAVSLSTPALLVTVSGSAQVAPQTPQAGVTPIQYRISFPEPEHHWLQVELTVAGLGSRPLQARMSRSSPGRYAISEFAKNVFLVEAYDSKGKSLAFTRPNVDEWDVAGHDGTVRLLYKLFGDHADGTYLGVDTTHAHLNMPATFMWPVGHDLDPVRFTFVPPAGLNWKVATQLYPTADPWTFTAPNLQYYMDSPTELSNFFTSEFTVPNADGRPAHFRVVVHGQAQQPEVDAFAKLVERLVREEEAVYGEFPTYEPGAYTFLMDLVPWGFFDGMEHRNSTSISVPGESIATPEQRVEALETVAHEFFHNWNVERIRPEGLEPFDFTRENVTCCLWLAEGFTQYYGYLLLTRAGFEPVQVPESQSVAAVINGSGRLERSAVQMSQYAPFSDAAVAIDMTDANRTFISYYTYGAAIALALDLSLREQSGGKTTLDDFMRALWAQFGKPGGPAPGLVGKPYTLRDLRDVLAQVSGNRAFAETFFDKYVEGREVADYGHLLSLAGYTLKATQPTSGWIGNVAVQQLNGGLVVGLGGRGQDGEGEPVPFTAPLYAAGVDEGDFITSIDGHPATSAAWAAIARKHPGETVTLAIVRRDGATATMVVTLKADPALQVEPIETSGGSLTPAQQAFRASWLGTRFR